MEDYKTIKELADELNVSKQTIQYHYQRLNKNLVHKNLSGVNLISKNAEEIIVNKVGAKNKSFATKNRQTGSKLLTKDSKDRKIGIKDFNSKNDRELAVYKKIISDKDQQIDTKDKQIDRLSNLLNQQQQLTLQSNKQIDQLQQQLLQLTPPDEPEKEQENLEEVYQKLDQMETLEKSLEEQKQLTLQANRQLEQLQEKVFLLETKKKEPENPSKEITLRKPTFESPKKPWWQFWK